MSEEDHEPAANPYAAPQTEMVAEIADTSELPELNEGKVFVRWLVVCCVAGAPSFFFGFSIGQGDFPHVAGMICGILAFVGGYCALEHLPNVRNMMRKNALRRAAWTAYLSRMGISVLYPLAMFIDIPCGMTSVGLNSAIFGDPTRMGMGLERDVESLPAITRFFFYLFTTITQGILLNIVLFVFLLLIWGVLAAIASNKPVPELQTPAQT